MSANVKRMAFTGQMPWWIGTREDHGQWKRLEGYATAQEMLDACEMDFDVRTAPMFILNEAGQPIEVPERFAVVRNDTNAPISGVAVGKGYEPIPFREMFAIGDEVTTKPGLAHWETAGTLYDGRTGWGLIKLEADMSIAGDWIATYLLATTSHDGTESLVIKLVNTRVVCCNTFGWAMAEKSNIVRIKHTKNYRMRVEDAQRILNMIPEQREQFQKFANCLLAKRIDVKTYEKLHEILFPVPADTADHPLTNRVIDNINKKRTLLISAVDAPDLENIKWTAWGALQAVLDTEQHLLVPAFGKAGNETKLARMFEKSFNTDELAQKAAAFLAEV